MTLLSKYAAVGTAMLIPNVIGFLGTAGTKSEIKTWYNDIKKPDWRPPNWVFPIVWPSLYSAMGYASYMVWRNGNGFSGPARLPLTLYAINLVLNGIWSQIFFKWHRIDLAFYDSLLLKISTLSCIYTFSTLSTEAMYLLIPYFLWGCFASLLNFEIWRMNTSDTKKEN